MIFVECYKFGQYEFEFVIYITKNHIIQYWNKTFNGVMIIK
jgi:hypothetical protein